MAATAPKFPLLLQIPMITTNRKYLTHFFPFLMETRNLLKREQLPYQLSVCAIHQVTAHSYLLNLAVKKGDTWCSTICFWLLAWEQKGQSSHTPMSPHATRKHQGVAFISLRKVFGANPATFPECGALLESNESLMCSVAV